MKASYLKKVLSLFLMLISISSVYSYEGRPWYDENGKKTDLVNYNPDPNGEPWLAGGLKPLTRSQLAEIEKVPEITLNNKTRSRALPDEVILLNNDEFIPVFNQKGGSCAQASGVAYTYSYQLNVLKGVSGTATNARAYGYTHNYLNGGSNGTGSWYWDGWEILSNHGAPDVTTFHGEANGGLSGTRWMNGADRWHKANDNKATTYNRIKVQSMADIEKIKSWMYDLNGTDPHKKGGCVVFAANANSATGNSTVSSGPHAGDKLCTSLTKNGMDHAMTFAGYSDNVEGGALLLLNSWGTWWGTNGYVWVPYTTIVNGGLYNDEVWCVTVAEHTPKFELRATVSHNSRSNLKITTGFANGTATSPSVTKDYGKAFNYKGGALPIEGNGGSSSIEVSLDVSDFYDDMTGTEGTFFMTINNNSGSCSVKDLTLIDYTSGESVEYPASESNVTVSGTKTIAVTLSTTQGVTVTSPNGGEELLQGTNKSITWSDNISENVTIILLDSENNATTLTESTESDGSFDWSIADDFTAGDYKIVVTSVDDASLTDTSDAAFTVKEVVISDNMFAAGDWYVLHDEEYSGENASSGDLDTTLYDQEIVGADLEIGQTDNANIWPWAKLFCEVGNDMDGVSAIKITYKSNKDFIIGLEDTELSSKGEEYGYKLSASSSFTEVIVPIGSFGQPEWVSATSPLNLDEVMALSFGPDNSYGQSARIEIKNLQLYDFKGKAESIFVGTNTMTTDALNLHSIQNNTVSLSVPVNGTYTVSLYTLQGKQLLSNKRVLTNGINSVSLPVQSNQVLLFAVEGEGKKLIKKLTVQ